MSIGPLDSDAVESYREAGAGPAFPVTISTDEEASPSATPSVAPCILSPARAAIVVLRVISTPI
jgi:hypothetical protein